MSTSLRPLLLLLAGLAAVTPAVAHETRTIAKTPVKAEPRSDADTIGLLPPFRRVVVHECTGSGPRAYCYVTAPGPDGWVRATALEHPEAPRAPCPPACLPRP